MSITSIEFYNFKNFAEAKIDLKRFNVLIGANASGKSNFISLFKFLRDTSEEGIENAIALQGGIEYFRNFNIGSSQNFSLRIMCEPNYEYYSMKKYRNRRLLILITESFYDFELEFFKTKIGYKIKKDSIKKKLRLFFEDKKTKKREFLGEGSVNINKTASTVKYSYNLPRDFENIPEFIFFSFPFKRLRHPPKRPLIESPLACIAPFQRPFSEITFFDIDPRLAKKAVPFTGKIDLEEDGSNLAVVLNYILRYKKQEKRFSNLLRDLLPFIEKVHIDKIADKSLLFKFKERYFSTRFLPASFISDGTVQIAALILALYFERTGPSETSALKIIEEPERNIHPYLISKIISMMEDASSMNQIITTTHNPEIVKYVELDSILLINRDKNGYSNIFRPTEKEEIKTFLKNEIGIEELYIKNLLGT